MLKIHIEPLSKDELKKLPQDVLVSLDPPFVDDRGFIQPLVDIPMKSAVIIKSNNGTVRANHYHQTDWHYCTVITGEIKYYWRDHGDTSSPESIIVRSGQTFFTPPMVEHALYFPINTEFIALAKLTRKSKNYEKDTVRINLI